MVTAILLAISFSVTLIDAYIIEGSLTPPVEAPMDWHAHTRIHVDGSQYVGFVRPDGTFQVSGVPSGSYLIEPIHPSFIFQTARVDINSKGRIRARRVNAPQPNAVDELPYPLKLSTHGKAVYFKPREQLRTIDLLFNPNVLYVLVPFLLVMVLTKMVNTNDPELQKELQQMNLQQQLPDMSELLSSVSLFGDRKKPSGSGKRRVTDDGNRAIGTTSEAGFGSATHHGSSGRKEKKRRAQ
ncbi:ER membrane protein complex subunit 7 [Clonorchis sinensis]|uniref:ER membrane protein complex subunit 7 n=2 Tax=Clonorchis sinensis TaxID=79923 RepID=A0A8T1MW94_CLOSI|nr:ER membrane protein complex subunit 7 [Clonorchis sinensis]GAA42231.2 UPF0480 protein C15orf24 homolog [Clonorchis sinensis]